VAKYKLAPFETNEKNLFTNRKGMRRSCLPTGRLVLVFLKKLVIDLLQVIEKLQINFVF